MKNIENRIKALEVTAKAMEANRRQHEPFVLYQPWSITLDEFYVYYHPEGLFQKPQKNGPPSYADTCALLAAFPGSLRLQVSMGECAEWLFVFHQYSEQSKKYTPEQLERFKDQEIKSSPELAYLVTDEGAEMRRIMLRLPQTYTSRLDALQRAIREREVME